ncbi:MAG: hypothetical protein V1872_09820, partial [bacterium]
MIKFFYKILIFKFIILLFFVFGLGSLSSFSEAKEAEKNAASLNLGIYGGQINDIAISVDPDSNKMTLFAASYMGDGLYKSTDEGKNWESVKTKNLGNGEDTFKNHAVNVVKVAQSNNNIIWVAYDSYLQKSEDGGKTWEFVNNMQLGCEGCEGKDDDGRKCKSLAIDPTNSDIVYVGTCEPFSSSTNSGAIYRTTNGGESWIKMKKEFGSSSTVVDIAIDPT